MCACAACAGADPLWETRCRALGDETGRGEIHISGNSVSSSPLEMLPTLLEACTDEAVYTGSEEIQIESLDSIFHEYHKPGEPTFLKIDAQGFEQTVPAGATQSLKDIAGIQLEASLVPFYQGETLFIEMVEYISRLGYQLMSN